MAVVTEPARFSVAGWAVWQLPRGARALVLAVISCSALELAASAALAPVHARFVVAALVCTLAAVVSVELSMRLAWPRARRDRISRDFLGVWIMPVALLLPPLYVGAMVMVLCGYVHMRVWRGQLVKLVYSTSSLVLAYAAAGAAARGVLHLGARMPSESSFVSGPSAVLAIVGAIATWWLVNHALVAAVVALTAGPEAATSSLRDPEGLAVDLASGCLGVLVALLWAINPLLVALLVPPILLIQHQLFSGFRHAARTDLLTDVANPQFWRELAAREVDRAWASGTPLAVLMVDVDHFKNVNDRYGHLAGDEVLTAVARTLSQALRPRDLVGRLGGEEFGAVLSGLNLADVRGAAERVRAAIGELRVRSDRGDWIGVTVSIGVAELAGLGSVHGLPQLLDAADQALYAAKARGRNRVCVAPRPGVGADGTRRVVDITDTAIKTDTVIRANRIPR